MGGGDVLSIYRIIDANINRVSEGIRVLEDLCRFYYNDEIKTKELRELRHDVRKTFDSDELITYRDSINDIGAAISLKTTVDKKETIEALIKSNFKRIQEGLRTIEELLKVLGYYEYGKKYETLRFKSYYLEKTYPNRKFYFKDSIYAILGEDFSNGKDNIQLTKELIESGIKIIQYREKDKDKVYKLNQCKIIRELTKKNNVTFIVNDDIDIALAVKADGIHLGQEDMDSLEARKIAPNMIIGLSTHNKNQALLALEKKVDYIGVGPIFNTTTKKDIEYSEGLEYLKWVSKNIKLPCVTIGGIKEENLMDVISHGGKCFAMISELVSTENMKTKVNNIRKIINGINEEDNYELHNSNGCC